MADFRNAAFGKQHLNDIEAKLNMRVLKQAQVIHGAKREQAALAGIDRCGGTCPIFGRARLDFDKHQAVLLAKDQVYFSPVGLKIRSQKFETQLFQALASSAFAKQAVPQMQRQVGLGVFSKF